MDEDEIAGKQDGRSDERIAERQAHDQVGEQNADDHACLRIGGRSRALPGLDIELREANHDDDHSDAGFAIDLPGVPAHGGVDQQRQRCDDSGTQDDRLPRSTIADEIVDDGKDVEQDDGDEALIPQVGGSLLGDILLEALLKHRRQLWPLQLHAGETLDLPGDLVVDRIGLHKNRRSQCCQNLA